MAATEETSDDDPVLSEDYDYESIMEAVEDDSDAVWDDTLIHALAKSKNDSGKLWARFSGQLTEIDSIGNANSYKGVIGARAEQLASESPSAASFDADEFADELDVYDMNDRERARNAYDWIADNLDICAIEEESIDNGTLLGYDNGIWSDGGEKPITRTLNTLLQGTSAPTVTNTVINQYIKAENETNVSVEKLGLDPGLVAVKNGVLDLYEGEIIRDLEPADYATKMVPHEYHADAECERWEQFINEIIEVGKRAMIQEYVGYCLFQGGYPYAKALMLLGDGRNGKSTFLDTVEKLLGHDNVMGADLGELSEGRFSAYRLEGNLANINADIEGDEITHFSMFKNMTGGDIFQVEQKFGDPFDLQNSAKLIFAANKIPQADTYETAFYRRWLIVTFPNKFTLNEDDTHGTVDPDLEDTLEAEIEGILAWAVEGFQRLCENDGVFTNQRDPEEVMDDWSAFAEPYSEFIHKCLHHCNSEPATSTKEIYEAYKAFIKHRPSSPISQQKLTEYVKEAFDDPNYGTYRRDGDQFRGFRNIHIDPRKAM
ncbi:DNA primase family protein [Saliphagus infecundisoli]|uniref:Phage/plasmid primase, P4 family n=1 Tax=Saliphagus infecundisoli TaxID=1849069 RepID=A0ABD5QDC2_9EURY|nr:phage/plasmid primase, P4 family [Saliphagus infecundisoli]